MIAIKTIINLLKTLIQRALQQRRQQRLVRKMVAQLADKMGRSKKQVTADAVTHLFGVVFLMDPAQAKQYSTIIKGLKQKVDGKIKNHQRQSP